MKITGYNSSVNGVGMPSATVKAVGDLMAHGGNGSGYKAISKALNQVQIQYEQMAEEEDKRALMSAMDIYNKGRYNILYDDQEGVMNTKLDGAAGSVMTYQQKEQKLRNDIASNLKFKTKKYQLVFEDMVNKSAQQGYQLVDRHEYQEGEKQTDLHLQNNLTNEIEFAQKNYNSDDILVSASERGRQWISARYESQGKDMVEKMTEQYEARLATGIINQAIMRGEYDRAKEVQEAFNSAFTPEQRVAIEKAIFDKQKGEHNMALAESLASRYGEDIGGMLAELEGTNAFGTDRLMNLAERHTVLNLAQSIINTNKAIEKSSFDNSVKGALGQARELQKSGMDYITALQWATGQGGNDKKAIQAFQSAVNIAYDRGFGAGMQPISDGEMYEINQALGRGVFDNLVDYLQYMRRRGATDSQIVKAETTYNQYINRTGQFGVNWEATKDMLEQDGFLKKGQDAKWNAAKAATCDEITRFIAEKNRPPEPFEIKAMIMENMNTGIRFEHQNNFFDWVHINANQLELAVVGIRNVMQIGDRTDQVIVTRLDGRQEQMSIDVLDDILERNKGVVK